jgi:hypothetical protein
MAGMNADGMPEKLPVLATPTATNPRPESSCVAT